LEIKELYLNYIIIHIALKGRFHLESRNLCSEKAIKGMSATILFVSDPEISDPNQEQPLPWRCSIHVGEIATITDES
jgi:hypothetical protein